MAKQGTRPGQGSDKRAENALKQDTECLKQNIQTRTKPGQGSEERAWSGAATFRLEGRQPFLAEERTPRDPSARGKK